jgi:hypothetical protein
VNDFCNAVFSRCSCCEELFQCKDGQRVVKNHKCPDRDPDALTNDYIYMRGEFDSFIKMSALEIKTASSAYEAKIVFMRKELGLDAI